MGGGKNIDVRKLYGIPSDKQIILYIGNLCHRKNQKQIIDAFDYLPQNVADNCYVLFMGRAIEDDYHLEESIKKSKNAKQFVLCGNIDKEEVPDFYSEANGVVLLSISEGFGLSLIEGMHFGIPCMCFDDMDAFEDIYDPSAVVALHERSNVKVANGICELLGRKWDRDKIIGLSNQFTLSNMAQKYIEQYNNWK